MRITEWPRMPFLNEEVREWITIELRSLGVEDLAVYALEAGPEGDERRVLVATEIGLLDHRYAPYGSSARYRLAMLLYPWQVLRGVELRADTFRLWAREHRTRWSFRLHHPHFEAATESPDLGQALCDLARVCAVMAEPFGVPAGTARATSDDEAAAIPVGARRAETQAQAMARPTTPPVAPPTSDAAGGEPEAGDGPSDETATAAAPAEPGSAETDGAGETDAPADDAEAAQAAAQAPARARRAAPVVPPGEEIVSTDLADDGPDDRDS